ncbi:hypothetical protein BDD12DRAFT_983228 [Trichophaea hybrida]|nr:hypothetical protein BDD12DRAFT_983228 [Trichophaea hybrida]
MGTPEASNSGTRITVPKGWTQHPQALGDDYLWGEKSGLITVIAQDLNVQTPLTPIIAADSSTGNVMYLFRSAAGKHYIFNELEHSMLEIVRPTGIDQITGAMQQKWGLGGLELKLLEEDSPAPGG